MANNDLDFWATNLLPSKLGAINGVGGVEFYIAERRVETGRKFARYVYPYRNGQGVEDMGRKIYIFHLTIPLFQGVAEGLYPGAFDKLLAINDDEGTKAEVEYQDPEFGPIKVKIDGFDWQTTPQQRNGGVLTLVLEEISFEQSLTENLNKPQFAARSLAGQRASWLDYAMDVLEVSLPDISDSKFPSLSELWADVQNGLDTDALAADDIAGRIDEVTLVAQHIMDFSAEDEIQRWSIVNAVIDFQGAAEDVGKDSGSVDPSEKLVSYVLSDDMSMYDIAIWLYKDVIRAEEIAFNNPTSNPARYSRGTTIKAFAK